jgi:hypothetical protein
MADFLIQIRTNGQDQTPICERLQKAGFNTTITSDESLPYKLPDGIYQISGDLRPSQVSALIAKSIEDIRDNFPTLGVLISEYESLLAEGLKKLQ